MDFVQSLNFYEAILFIAAGLTVLFFGYRIKKIAFFIIWFLLGYNLMVFLMPVLNNLIPEITTTEFYQILLPIAGGLLLALLGFSIEKICVAGICFALIMMIVVKYFGTDIQTLAVGAIVGVIAAAAAVALMKPAIIIATSIAGAYALTLAFFTFINGISFETFYWPILIGISVVGSFFQFLTTKRVS